MTLERAGMPSEEFALTLVFIFGSDNFVFGVGVRTPGAGTITVDVDDVKAKEFGGGTELDMVPQVEDISLLKKQSREKHKKNVKFPFNINTNYSAII